LQQEVALACLALHVIDGVFVLDIGIEAKDHAVAISVSSKMGLGAMITEVRP
jgi:hypothetical protein